jgi:lipopolysaccharide/colanic/teichoic acid biosynthesis glycosyltransferase
VGKRLFDLVVSLFALILLSPILLLVAALVKITSKGPALFGQVRVGQNEKPFTIWKFRSMCLRAEELGPPITASGDRRITPFGAFLRKSKLDEVPQLWNVLKGDMSFVGPRPELHCYVVRYSTEQRRVLAVKPGITDLASLQYREEERLLKNCDDPERYYREIILPHKLTLNLQYMERVSLLQDLALILSTVRSVLVFFGKREITEV